VCLFFDFGEDKMNELVETNNIKIENMIYEVRGKQVMLDSDLAKLYECTNGTKDINKAVNRNKERFPNDFYFQLLKEEYDKILRFQTGTSSLENTYGGRRFLPYVFTEQGVAMLSAVLRTKKATLISVNIMKAFVIMRKYISNNLLEQQYYKDMLIDDHNRINLLEESFDNLEKKEKINQIFYKGQIYDAYSVIVDIIISASKSIVIIDNYVDKSILDLLTKKNKNVKVLIITTRESKLISLDINKFNKEYPSLKVVYSYLFHDRFILIDNCVLYHCGASIKDLGNKRFAINKIEDKEIVKILVKKINFFI